jgi:chromosome segregation ATPase
MKNKNLKHSRNKSSPKFNHLTTKEFEENRKFNSLKEEFSKIERINEKNKIKISQLTNELIKLKEEYNKIEKQLSLSKKTNEIIIKEKENAENVIKDNKLYIIKLENKIIELSKSKSFNLYDEMNKLNKENGNLRKQNLNMESIIERLKIENNNLKQEITNSSNDIVNNEYKTLLENNYKNEKLIINLKKEIEEKNLIIQNINKNRNHEILKLNMNEKNSNDYNFVKDKFNLYLKEINLINKEISEKNHELSNLKNRINSKITIKNIYY